MRRVKLCSIILVVLVFFSVSSLWLIDFKCDSLVSQITGIQSLCEKKETTQALVKTEQLNRSWNNCYKLLSCLVKSDRLSEIDRSMARIGPFIENSSDDLSSELQSMLYQIDLLRETEFPYIYNIF